MTAHTKFIEGLPKTELHLHIEGSHEPEQMFAFAARNNISLPYTTIEDVRAAYQFTELQDFLDIYYQGMGVLQTEQDFYDLTHAYLTKVHEQNVMHVEIFFDPQGHTDRGISIQTAIEGISHALEDGSRNFGISYRLIMCFLRHLSEDAAMETLEQALPFKDKICGVGLDSSELGHPPSKFQNVFRRAKQEGFKLVAHAGEEGPPSYVTEALDLLKVDRLDHGNRSLEDAALTKRLAHMEMALTVCPLSNYKLAGVTDMRQHPLREMLSNNLKATINSDDPAYFGGYMTENYLAVADALDLNKEEIIILAQNGINATFCTDTEKAALHQKLNAYLNQWTS